MLRPNSSQKSTMGILVCPHTMLVMHVMSCTFIHIAILFSALAVHGYVTDDLSFSTVLQIPEGKHLNYSDSTNYRGIAQLNLRKVIWFVRI